MARTNKDTVALIRIILQDHLDYWEGQSTILKQYKNAYENRFWEGQTYDESMIRIETADCFHIILLLTINKKSKQLCLLVLYFLV